MSKLLPHPAPWTVALCPVAYQLQASKATHTLYNTTEDAGRFPTLLSFDIPLYGTLIGHMHSLVNDCPY